MADIEIEGLKELDAAMNRLADNVKTNIVNSGLRAAASVVRKKARNNLSSEYARYKKAITVKLLRPKSPFKVTAIVGGGVHKGKDRRTKEPVTTDFWFAHIVELGTLGSRTEPLSPNTKRRPHRSPFPKGLKAKPFLRPAFDSSKNEMVKAFADKMWQRIEKAHLKR